MGLKEVYFMEKRKLGKTDILITPIGLGCWQFARRGFSTGFWGAVDQETADKTVSAALNGGINWFDTAEAYGNGQSEKALALALKGLGIQPGAVRIATKWMPFFRTANNIGRTIGIRLACLDPFPIDLYQVHMPVSFSPISKQMKAMAELYRQGKIKAVGVSNFSAAQMEEAHAELASAGIPLASNQVRYSLLNRGIEKDGTLETAKKLGVTLIAYSPLAQGILSGRFHDDPAAVGGLPAFRKQRVSRRILDASAPLVAGLRKTASAHRVSASQVALNWLVSFHGDTVVAIPGATKPVQAQQAAGAMDFSLTPDESARLDELSRGF
jgi:aryl-alcohol dehydrogenase-like predicted oxidoreductase